MVIFRAFLALVAGFLTMALLVGVITALLVKTSSSFVGEIDHPRPAYIAINFVYSFIAAAAGGYVTAWIATQNTLAHVLGLALVVLILSALSAIQQRGRQPLGYQLTLVALSPVGITLGGLLRLKLTGLI